MEEQGLSRNAKRKIIIGLTIAGMIGGLYVVYRGIRRAKLLREFGDIDVIKDDNKGNLSNPDITGSTDVIVGGEGADVRPNFDPEPYAYDLYDSMKNTGWNKLWGYTDEELLEETLAKLTCAEMQIVKEYFMINYGDGETLREWVIGDTSGDLKDRLLEMIDCDQY